MTYLAVGLNHRSAPTDLLEELTLPAETVLKALAELTSHGVVNEAVVISTCNRTEFYLHAERFHDGFRICRDALALVSGIDVDRFGEYLYVHHGGEAVEHLFNVTAGLDSVVLGEHEVLGQIRSAWDTARSEGTSRALLDPLFEHAIVAGQAGPVRDRHRPAHRLPGPLRRRTRRGPIARPRRTSRCWSSVPVRWALRWPRRWPEMEYESCSSAIEPPRRPRRWPVKVGGQARSLADLTRLVQSADVIVTATGATGIPDRGRHVRASVASVCSCWTWRSLGTCPRTS